MDLDIRPDIPEIDVQQRFLSLSLATEYLSKNLISGIDVTIVGDIAIEVAEQFRQYVYDGTLPYDTDENEEDEPEQMRPLP